jgi:hypothetical protein
VTLAYLRADKQPAILSIDLGKVSDVASDDPSPSGQASDCPTKNATPVAASDSLECEYALPVGFHVDHDPMVRCRDIERDADRLADPVIDKIHFWQTEKLRPAIAQRWR